MSNPLVEDAIKAYQPVIDEATRRQKERDQIAKETAEQVRANVTATAQDIMDEKWGRHDGVSLYCLLGGFSGREPIRTLTSNGAVKTVVYRIEQTETKIAVHLADRKITSAVNQEPTSGDDGMNGWFFGSQKIESLQELGRWLHEIRRDLDRRPV